MDKQSPQDIEIICGPLTGGPFHLVRINKTTCNGNSCLFRFTKRKLLEMNHKLLETIILSR